MRNKRVVLFGFAIMLTMAAAAMIGCVSAPDKEPPLDKELAFPSGFIGTWRRDFQSVYTNTLTFTSKTLKASNQPLAWELINVSGSSYTILYGNTTDWTAAINVRLNNGKLEISDDPGTDENDWNGTWRK
jgi:hypothetical protein